MKKIYLAWSWIDTENYLDIIYPYTWETFDKVCLAWKKEINEAIEKAWAWFEKTRRLSPYERAEILKYIVSELTKQKEEFAKLLVMENWKTIKEARGEMDRCISTFEIAIWEATRIYWEYSDLWVNSMSVWRQWIVKYFPIWVIAWIVPFNFPMNLAAHKIAPAITTWCPIIIKPASSTPLSMLKFAEIIEKSQWPKEAFSVLPASREDGQILVEDERIKLLSFTGSPHVWWKMKEQAWKKKVVLELGWNAWVIIDQDYESMDWLIDRLTIGWFYQAGQSCISVQKIFIHETMYDLVKNKLIEKLKTLKTWDPMNEETFIGWIIDKKNRDRLWKWIKEAIESGATCPIWNKWDWTILEPTLLENVSDNQNISKEEAFWPVAVMYKFSGIDEAIKMVNNSKFWLQVWIFSKNIDTIRKVFEEVEVWGVIQNDVPSFRVDSMPYGWVKDSWLWREWIKYAMKDMLEEKILVLKPEI